MIPQSVDVTVFRPLDRTTARLELGVPAESRVLMTAAVNLDHWRKGADLLRLALARLPEHWKRRLVLLTMGKEGNGIGRFAGIRTRHLGFVSEERRRVLAYAASDLFVMTSRADMTANVITESLACGTPVAAFAVGGVPEAVRPGLTGTLAEPGDVEGLSLGIASLLADDALMGVMRRKCREVAVEEYALDLQVDRHLAVYRYLVGPAHSSEPAEAHPAATRAVPAA